MKRIVMISNGFPWAGNPVYPFIEQLAAAFADEGMEVSVISPYSALKLKLSGTAFPPAALEVQTRGGARFSVYRPRYSAFSDSILGVNTARLSLGAFTRAVRREIAIRNLSPDVVYGHFIALSGLCAAQIGREMGVPAFFAYGESSPKNFQIFSSAFLRRHLASIRGVVAVSSEGKRILREMNFLPPGAQVRVFPNAVNPEVFRPMDRAQARAALNLPADRFIAAFVGGFIKRKGVRVLEAALEMLPDAGVLFIGKGPVEPETGQALFIGSVENREIYKYLSAADVFVLPTTNEGCCNAIVEALACGLPVVSSDLPFNADILSSENAILVNPEDAQAVACALKTLRDDPALRQSLADGAIRAAQNLTLRARAENILSFLREANDEKYKGEAEIL